MSLIPHGKHKGRSLDEVVRLDPNYALHAHINYGWFPKLSCEQIQDCNHRYVTLRHDWSAYDMADYGDGWM